MSNLHILQSISYKPNEKEKVDMQEEDISEEFYEAVVGIESQGFWGKISGKNFEIAIG